MTSEQSFIAWWFYFSPVYNTLGASTKCNIDKGNYHHV